MKKETAIVALVVVAVGSFLLGRFTAGKTEIVASGTEAAAPAAAAPAPAGDVYRVPVGSSAWKGAQHAKVTIVEFSEFQCPFCARVLPTLQRILHEYKDQVKLVFKHNPLGFHQHAQLAAEAAMAAGEQGKFWELHDKLFANQQALARPDLERHAQDLGLDMGRFKQALDSGKFKAAVLADQRLAQQVGADGTPSFFINGRLIAGAMPFDAFKKVIDEEMKRADAALARGVPLAGLYDELVKGGLTAKRPPAPAAAAGADQVYKVPADADSPSKGPATAKVTIVEFSEFQCPFCARVLPTMQQLLKDYEGQIRVVFKHNPLPFHKDAPLASEAAMAAHAQGKFWEYHDKLFANQRALGRPELERYAADVGLDVAAFKAALDGGKHKGTIARDMAQARQFGAMGTPTFFLNGRKIAGASPVDAFKRVVDEEIKKADAALARGVRPEMLYAELTKGGLDRAAPPPPPRPAEDAKAVYKVPVGKDEACKGEKNALVTIVEFSEFQCPFCARVLPTLDELFGTYRGKLRVCFKHNPLPFHKDAVPASIAAIEAHRQKKFWKLHDILFKNQRALSRADLEKHAALAGLDVAKVKAALDTGKGKDVIDGHMKLAADLGARGTPTFFINGRKLVGAQPLSAFKALIDEELPKAEALLKRGVAKRKIYDEVIKNGLTKVAAAAPAGRPADDAKAVYKVEIPKHAPCKGPRDAEVTIAEFSEFQCPFCARVVGTLKELGDTYTGKLRVCFLHQPLPFHKDASAAAHASIAAHKQGKFWEYHDKLFANQRALSSTDLERYAVELGLDMERFKADSADPAAAAQVKADQDIAAKLGARGTPTFFLNGRKLVGAQPAPAFKAIIDEELKKTSALLKRGVPKKRLYQELIKNGLASAAQAPAAPAGPPPDDDKVYDVPVGDAPLKGPADAPVTIIAFSDFQCPFCGRVNPTLRQLEEEFPGKVRVAWKHYPLPFHTDAPLAHQASLAAHEQGKFWEYHDKLFANQRALKREDLERYAQELGLNMDQFRSALDSGKYKAKVDADMAEAAKVGVRGTPSFLINGKKLVGAQPFERFKEKVLAALRR
jgi:protein-disulfide isomerase